MKHKLLAVWFSLWFMSCLGGRTISAAAQPTQTTANIEEQTRDLVKQFKAGKVAGVEVVIYLKGQAGALLPVAPTYEFRAHDVVKFSIRSNFRGYVYLVNQGPSGKYRLLFPGKKERNLVYPSEEKMFPSSYGIEFNEISGKEIVQVFLSKERIGFFEQIARRDFDGELSDTQVAQLQKLWKSSDTKLTGVVKMEAVNAGKPGALRAVETRTPIFDLRKKESLILMQKTKNAARKQITASAFSINLKNNGVSQ